MTHLRARKVVLCGWTALLPALAHLAGAQTAPCPGGLPPAFDGAEGAGRCTQGGRGGPVVRITTLADDPFDPPAGSARHCLQVMSGPRICQAAVTGWVDLGGEDILVRHPYVTFEGVANGHALGFKHGGIFVRASQTIWRQCRVLPGVYQLAQRSPPQNANGIMLWSNEDGTPTSQHIIDHCSIGYTTDDHTGGNASFITIQDTILGPALDCTLPNGLACGGKGILLQSAGGFFSVIRVLQANTYIRHPELTSGHADIINTVNHNSNGTPAQLHAFYNDISMNFVGNVFTEGPNSRSWPSQYPSIRTKPMSYNAAIHVADNIGRCWGSGGSLLYETSCSPATGIIWSDGGPVTQSATFIGAGLSGIRTPMPASQTLAYVLANAGPFPRSAFENKIVGEVQSRTGSWPFDENEYGGWPALSGAGATPPPPPPPSPVPAPSPPPPSPVPPPTGTYALSASPLSVVAGGQLTAVFNAPSDHMTTDWIGLYPIGAPDDDSQLVSYQYVPAGASGSLTFAASTAAGSFQFRYFTDNSHNRAAASQTITVTGGSSPPQAAADINGDGATNAADVQLAVNQALGLAACGSGDVDRSGACDVADVQRVVNAVLGG